MSNRIRTAPSDCVHGLVLKIPRRLGIWFVARERLILDGKGPGSCSLHPSRLSDIPTKVIFSLIAFLSLHVGRKAISLVCRVIGLHALVLVARVS